MAERSASIDKVLCQLPSRVKLASDVLDKLCRTTQLSSLLSRNASWAIFGGVVRDLILAPEMPRPLLLPIWPDVDIALSRPTEALRHALTNVDDNTVQVKRNSYGGLKILERHFGVIDAWTWQCADEADDMFEFWQQQLESVDFGMNAVAFVWPECRILIHPRWRADLEERRVERLAPNSPRRELQPVRALALADKLSSRLKCRFSLGTDIREELQWLLSQEDEAVARECVDYLREKIDSGRWRESLLKVLRKSLGKRQRRLAFGQLFASSFEMPCQREQRGAGQSDAVQMLLFSTEDE